MSDMPSQPHDPYNGQQPPAGQPPHSGQPPYGGQQPPFGQGQQPLRPEDEKLWATLIHVGGILFYFIPSLVGYLVLKDRGPFIREHTRVALNFQITMAIAGVIGAATTVIVIGGLILLAVAIVVIVFSILAAIAANKGLYYKYPLSIEFIKD
ncbi:DUF4870 domain-containing protein [Frigoribacterium sp. 2-23]|uniref:DUF4870 domain-containing protein n=1 Tax=Frigoribacterium sp. 2-23 TaxID=3415006 RepID=UPI003C6FC952